MLYFIGNKLWPPKQYGLEADPSGLQDFGVARRRKYIIRQYETWTV